jgi:hypothetical protein
VPKSLTGPRVWKPSDGFAGVAEAGTVSPLDARHAYGQTAGSR